MRVAGIAHLEIVVKVLKDLGIEIVSARLRPLVEALVFCVLDHTNDFEIGGMCGIAFDAKPAANWRTTRKIDARHRFVDYGDLRRCGGILRAKSASDEYGNSHRGEVARSDCVVGDVGVVSRIWSRPEHGDWCAPRALIESRQRHAVSPNARFGSYSLFELLVEIYEAGIQFVAKGRRID